MKKRTKILSLLLVFILVISMAGLAGCSKGNNANKATVTKEADIVVVGGGTSGLAASIEAASEGKKVILLEKEGALGGSGNFAEGVFAVDSSVQKAMGIQTNAQQVEQILLQDSHNKISSKLWELIINSSAANIAWLQGLGVKFTGVDSIGVGQKTWHIYDGGGAAVIKQFAAKAKELGVEVMVNTPANEIIMNNGTVAGVKATSGDKAVVINAKAVIIATGGFAGNKDMAAQKTGVNPARIFYAGPPGNTGDGINMAAKAGAVSQGTPMLMMWPGLEGYTLASQMNEAAALEPNNLWVNQDGVRFVNEDITLHPTNAANAVVGSPQAFSILDTDAVNRLTEKGCIVGAGAYVPRGSKLTKLNDEVQAALDKKSPNVFKADTLEQLADQMGVDKAALTATVNKYNEEAVKGADSEYGKAAMFMAPVKTGPFYAFSLKGMVVVSMGGITVNAKNEVLNADQKAIPGLYAAGMDLNGFEGDTYTMEVPGSQQAISQITGKNAATNAAKYISQ